VNGSDEVSVRLLKREASIVVWAYQVSKSTSGPLRSAISLRGNRKATEERSFEQTKVNRNDHNGSLLAVLAGRGFLSSHNPIQNHSGQLHTVTND
jgi:hypothetical protein